MHRGNLFSLSPAGALRAIGEPLAQNHDARYLTWLRRSSFTPGHSLLDRVDETESEAVLRIESRGAFWMNRGVMRGQPRSAQ